LDFRKTNKLTAGFFSRKLNTKNLQNHKLAIKKEIKFYFYIETAAKAFYKNNA